MKVVRTGAAAILVGLMTAYGIQGQMVAKADVSGGGAPAGTEINVTKDVKYRWGEHQIAVNPKNPKNILYVTVGTGFTKDCQEHSPDCQMVMTTFMPGVTFPQAKGIFANPKFNVIGAYSSMDGGKTWKRAIIPVVPVGHPDINAGGDPSVIATPDGTFYVSFDAINWGTSEKPQPNAGIGVTKSTDGGLTWSTPVLTGTPTDGPKLTVDLNTGTIYGASSSTLGPHSTGDVNSPPGKINDRWLVSSKDGVHWTTPQGIGGFALTSAAHGMFAAAFKTSAKPNMFSGANNVLCDSAPTPCIVFETTTDAGATWSRHAMPVLNLKEDVGFGPGEQPTIAADPSKAGHFAVAVPMNGKEFDVYQTLDSGNTWSGPVIVTDDDGKRHYHGAMAFSRQGVLGIMWRTMQPAPGQPAPTGAPAGGPGGGTPYAYNVWAAISKDGGTTFSAPLKVSGKDSLPPEGSAFGNAGDDYSSIAIDGNDIYVGWAHWLTSDQRQGFLRALKVSEFTPKH